MPKRPIKRSRSSSSEKRHNKKPKISENITRIFENHVNKRNILIIRISKIYKLENCNLYLPMSHIYLQLNMINILVVYVQDKH